MLCRWNQILSSNSIHVNCFIALNEVKEAAFERLFLCFRLNHLFIGLRLWGVYFMFSSVRACGGMVDTRDSKSRFFGSESSSLSTPTNQTKNQSTCASSDSFYLGFPKLL